MRDDDFNGGDGRCMAFLVWSYSQLVPANLLGQRHEIGRREVGKLPLAVNE